MPSGVHYRGQEDVSEPVNAESAEVIFGEIQLKPTPEILDSPGQFMPSQRCDRCRLSLKVSFRCHRRYLHFIGYQDISLSGFRKSEVMLLPDNLIT